MVRGRLYSSHFSQRQTLKVFSQKLVEVQTFKVKQDTVYCLAIKLIKPNELDSVPYSQLDSFYIFFDFIGGP